MEIQNYEQALAILETGMDHPLANEAIIYMMTKGPPEIQSLLRDGFEKFFGPLPQPSHIGADGSKYWTVDSVAEFFKSLGVSRDELDESVEELAQEHDDLFLTEPPDGLQRIQ
ncbi:MAG: hypothetical protein HQL50_11760 [Magnetococcales bacterium]|nr:hypothetical protein [Magnetococcales bacterium]